MNKYQVTPKDETDYYVFADYVEVNGEWLLFFKAIGGDPPEVVHACSSHYTKYVNFSK